jgi:hypothetical protein
MAELVRLEDFRKRSSWISRAAETRARMVADDSPPPVVDDSSRKSTSGTSTWRSIRPNYGPEVLFR